MTLRLLICFLLLMISARPVMADVNVLVIGSPTDSSSVDYSSDGPIDNYDMSAASVSAFDPTDVVAELTNILGGASKGAVNVVFEDFNGSTYFDIYQHTNLFSWFHFPFLDDQDSAILDDPSTGRWPNLRGESGTEWDYVVLIGDAHTIEYLPGFYALGVSEIAKEVAKGSAETVLLMPWPAQGSSSSIEHYKEVVYRVGRSSGCAVAPAGLAWEASGELNGISHPTSNGAYIAAATLYSRLFNESASASAYGYGPGGGSVIGDALADSAHAAVVANKGAVQYTGKFATPHPHSAQFNSNRNVDFSITGTSTERGHIATLIEVMDECRVESSKYFSHRYDTNDPGTEGAGWPTDEAGDPVGPIDFNFGKFDFYSYDEYMVNPEFWKRAYIFQYQDLLTEETARAKIFYQDMSAGVRAYTESTGIGATIPRSGWAMLYRLKPDIEMNGGGQHINDIAILPNASFIYTVDSGRCPLTPEVASPTDEWDAMRVGYEAGWMMSNLQARAPGFRVLPSAADKQEINNYNATGTEEMTVQFIFEPEASVTVYLTSSNPSLITISPSTLTFTPGNHDVAQSYTVSIADGAAATEEEITVNITTTSTDEVYDDLGDSWAYTAKAIGSSSLPVAVGDDYRVGVSKVLTVAVDAGVIANDITNPLSPITQVALMGNVSHGTLNLSSDGSFSYRPSAGFEGKDSFTYRATNTNGSSEAVTVAIAVSDLDPSLILWYDFEEINGATVKDSTAYERDGTTKGSIPQIAGVADGKFGADLNGASIDIPIDQEFYDLVDSEISIAFWSYIDPVAASSNNSHSYILKGTKTYGVNTYDSLSLRFQTRMSANEYSIWWENGIYTQGSQFAPVGSASTYKLRLQTADHGLTPSDINDQWVHWTFMRTRESGHFRIYKDGVLLGEESLAGLNEIGLIDEIDDLVLGDSFKGKVDDFRIYNRELSASEIAGIMVESSPPPSQAWTGNAASDNLWVTPGNWSLGTLPEAGSTVEISNGDRIDITSDAEFPALSKISLLNGELAIAAGAHLDLESGSVFKLDGGSITSVFDGENISIGISGVSSVFEMDSGSIAFTSGAGSDVTFIYSDLTIRGGSINTDSQNRLYGGLTIQGSAATIDFTKFKGFDGSTIHFVLDEIGVSPINVGVWANIEGASISIDGSSYTGGAATIPLINSTNLLNLNDGIAVTGFEARGYLVEVAQSQSTNDVKLIVTEDTTDTDGDGTLDWQEVIMGTDPMDASSVMRIETQQTETGIARSWPTVNGRTYSVVRSDDLKEWEAHLEDISFTPGKDIVIDIPIDTSSPDQKFYRIEVQN